MTSARLIFADPALARPDLPVSRPGQRIGVFGGTFDPPHAGHVLVSRTVLTRLQLDAVWWLVSPGNPLKKRAPAPLSKRLATARDLACHPREHVCAPEAHWGTRATVDTLSELRHAVPGRRFVWIMGGDGLAHLHRWHRWQDLARDVPIAVVARPGARARALLSPAARWMAPFRLPERQAGQLPLRTAPAWSFLSAPLSALSSTALRAQNQTKGTDEQISSELR